MKPTIFSVAGVFCCLLPMAVGASAQTGGAIAASSAPTPVPVPVVPVLPAVPAAPENGAITTPVTVSNDYKLDVDDSITITVMRHGDVGGSFRIAPDGLIRLQRLTTPIDVRGKTAAELTDIITQKLQTEGKLVLHPGQVTVSVVGLRMHRIFIRGNAVAGREIDLRNGWRIDDIVALMSGVPQPDRLTTQITSPLRPAPVTFNLAKALANPASPDNIELQEGDTITFSVPQAKRLLIKGEGPRGMHDVDERFGLRATLISMGFSTNGASGDLRHSRIIRNETPGNYDTPATYIPVDIYTLLTDDTKPDIRFHDLDTLEIPVSQDYVYVLGEIGGPRKQYLPQDRKTHLVDIYVNAGDVTGNAKVGSVKVMHADPDGSNVVSHTYDLAKYLKDGVAKENPEIHPHDIIFVPTNNRIDPVNSIWTGFGLFNIFKALVPGAGL